MGLATALGFAHFGRRVTGYEKVSSVRASLRQGRTHFHEPGLADHLRREIRRGRLRIVDSWSELIRESDIVFLCLPTPPRPGGGIDLRPLLSGARELGRSMRTGPMPSLIVVKSTVVPGTTVNSVTPAIGRAARVPSASLQVAACPEFLAEGSMMRDVLRPERVVIGVTSRRSEQLLRAAYRGVPAPLVTVTPTEAELTKYASNAVLATKLAFVDEVARIAEATGSDIDAVARAMGLDGRIGPAFLSAGPGFGGSCFEKDVRALAHRARELGVRARLIETVVPSNEDQAGYAFHLLERTLGSLRGKTIAVLGLAFKSGTDDVRETRALPLVLRALAAGARLRLHDPVAGDRFRKLLESRRPHGMRRVRFATTPAEALAAADLAVLQAAWPEYLGFPRAWGQRMKRPLVVDLRRSLTRKVVRRAGIRCVRLGDGSPGAGPEVGG